MTSSADVSVQSMEYKKAQDTKAQDTNAQDIKVLFGGTFDPFHNGHLAICQHVAQILGQIKKITLLPAHIPPHKAMATATSEQRIAMLEALKLGYALFEIDDRELYRDKPSYTFDTLAEMKAEAPLQALNFIIGMDSLLTLTKWHRWDELLTLCNLIVCTRPHYDNGNKNQHVAPDVKKYLTPLDTFQLSASKQIVILPPVNLDISSSEIRQQLSSGVAVDTLSHCLPEQIITYLSRTTLYR